MTTNRQILIALSPCTSGLARAAESPTMREWWDTSTSRSDLMWLVGRTHSRGILSRRALVLVAVRCCETVAHLMPADALPHLATIGSWAHGETDVSVDEINEARTKLWWIRRKAYAADAAYAAVDAAAYYATTDDAADAAYYATTATTAADAADAADYAAYAAAMCDVIRDAITIDEVCAALGLDPDQGVL